MTEETFCELLEKAINDEREAIEGYQDFFKIVPDKFKEILSVEEVNNLIIKPIIKDEEKHVETLKELKRIIC